jgi:hypothetical protein
VATADNQAVDQSLSRAQCLEAFESVARRHAQEFPDYPDVYEPLVHIAGDTPNDERAQKLAREILASPAPAAIKQFAQLLLDRQTLVGQSIEPLLGRQLAAKIKGQDVIVYSWSARSRLSSKLVDELKTQAPAAAVLIGINLDTDIANAEAFAAQASLPGELIYNAQGRGGSLPVLLKMNVPGLAYAVGKDGKVRSVSVACDVPQKIALLR